MNTETLSERHAIDKIKGVIIIINLHELEKTIKKDKIESCVVYEGGATLFEYYRNRKMKDKQHKINSVTKSVMSALYGIAIQQGYIDNEDVPISSYFSEIDDTKKEITIKHLLTMSSGLRWPGNEAMIPTKNWVKFILEQPVETEPGKQMKYSCGNSHLLSAILQKATKMNTVDFAKKNLFLPLGIHDFNWYQDAKGIAIGGFGLTMKIEDMLKFGVLYLQNGEWNSKQMIPTKWIKKSTNSNSVAESSYGYHWWIMNSKALDCEEDKTYYAMGMGGMKGQYIFVNQERRLVTVFTSNLSNNTSSPIQYFQNYILNKG
ncbi:serine hydrolase [Paenibacillus sp. EZ-K15]|uniref:serine hydrolase domain-containing protein n=1 Tax=Paenibacillus sp. EZ-K15 TaxID=2044275 RepID=UPI001F20FAE0|nr:serine hydrolase [Paenibacillus sp. EZ-K15]